MDKVQAAKQYAKIRGHEGRKGGWIYSQYERPMAHGWVAYADKAAWHRWIVKTEEGWVVNPTHPTLRPMFG